MLVSSRMVFCLGAVKRINQFAKNLLRIISSERLFLCPLAYSNRMRVYQRQFWYFVIRHYSISLKHQNPNFGNFATIYSLTPPIARFYLTSQTHGDIIPFISHSALHFLHQALQLCAEAGGLGFVIMHDGVFKQGVQPLDFLNRLASLWPRHLYDLYCVTRVLLEHMRDSFVAYAVSISTNE